MFYENEKEHDNFVVTAIAKGVDILFKGGNIIADKKGQDDKTRQKALQLLNEIQLKKAEQELEHSKAKIKNELKFVLIGSVVLVAGIFILIRVTRNRS